MFLPSRPSNHTFSSHGRTSLFPLPQFISFNSAQQSKPLWSPLGWSLYSTPLLDSADMNCKMLASGELPSRFDCFAEQVWNHLTIHSLQHPFQHPFML